MFGLPISMPRIDNSLSRKLNRLHDFSPYRCGSINGTILEILDPFSENYSRNEILRCIHIALLCIQKVPSERPPILLVGMVMDAFADQFLALPYTKF